MNFKFVSIYTFRIYISSNLSLVASMLQAYISLVASVLQGNIHLW